jgi:hypothetical protein
MFFVDYNYALVLFAMCAMCETNYALVLFAFYQTILCRLIWSSCFNYFEVIMCEKLYLYILILDMRLFIYVHNCVLPKPKKTSNFMVCTSKQELEMGSTT